jgi:hypothetical protein
MNLNVIRVVSKMTTSPVLDIQESLIVQQDKEKFTQISLEINMVEEISNRIYKNCCPSKRGTPRREEFITT